MTLADSLYSKRLRWLAPEPIACEMCGAKKELRPYGPNGENVCFACAMKDKEAAEKQFRDWFIRRYG